MLSQLRPKDQVIVWRLDRLARSLKHLLEIIDVIQDRGAELISITEKLDTSSPGGRLIFHVFASIAEFERELMVERTERDWLLHALGDAWEADLANGTTRIRMS